MAGAEGRILHRHGAFTQARGDVSADRRRMIADHHHDPLAAERQGGIDGVIDHGAAADGVQHFGHGRFHSLPPAGGEDDGGASRSIVHGRILR